MLKDLATSDMSFRDLKKQRDKTAHDLTDLQLAVGEKKRELRRLEASMIKKEVAMHSLIKLEVGSSSSDVGMPSPSGSSNGCSGSDSEADDKAEAPPSSLRQRHRQHLRRRLIRQLSRLQGGSKSRIVRAIGVLVVGILSSAIL